MNSVDEHIYKELLAKEKNQKENDKRMTIFWTGFFLGMMGASILTLMAMLPSIRL